MPLEVANQISQGKTLFKLIHISARGEWFWKKNSSRCKLLQGYSIRKKIKETLISAIEVNASASCLNSSFFHILAYGV